MAEALLSPVLTSILESLSSLTVRELSASWGVESELENLRSTLITTRAVLQDAEQKQWKSEAVKIWLRKLKFAAYRIEDVIDEFSTEAALRKLKREKGVLCQVSTLLSLPNQLMFRSKIGRKINEVKENFDALARERQFHLVSTMEPNRRPETSSLITEPKIYGRDDVKEKIIDMLQRNFRNDLLVCAICGMGGVGKTTLAQAVYNDERVKNHFDLTIWIFVSEEFDMQRLTRAILESIEGGASDVRELDNLQQLLKGKLTEMKFLLVLDDVWNDDMEKWNAMTKLLSSGVKGSSVILTTRMQKIADVVSSHTYFLESLSEDDSWSLFKQCAIGTHRTEEEYMKKFGKAMLKKCCGVPLAIKALGSLLNTKDGEDEWRLVVESEMWDLEQGESGILSALRLSYCHLAPHLRQCFTYCCNFPKNHVMDKDNLIQLWMANEFIPAKGRMELFDIGNVIFHELVSRSFIQDVAEHEDGTTCKVHDLMHDLASSIMRGEFFSTKTMVGLENFEEVHHLCLDGTSKSGQVPAPSKLKALRSLFVFTEMSDSLSKRMHLRVLEMEIVSRALIDYSKLKHLRYLSFSRSKIECLPKSVVYLQNLQTLNLKECRRLSKLAKGMECMKSLRYLDIRGCWDLEMPPDMLLLGSLRIWTNGCVLSMCNGHDMVELRGKLFYGQLTLENLEQVTSSVSAQFANLKIQKKLRSLSLCWQDNEGDNIPLDSDEVLDSLQPHPNLRKIEIFCYQGSKFPNWFSNNHLQNLVYVSLCGCRRCECLPPLGRLSFLRELEILDMQSVKYFIWECYDERLELFPALERLLLGDMPSLVAWTTTITKRVIFPRLINLTLWGLPFTENLLGELGNIKSLDSLRLEYCYNLISLPVGALQDLSSLRSLFIYNSEKFVSLSEGVQYLTALSTLKIWDCSKLTSIPEGLQKCTALETLEIRGCPNLRRRCQKETGEDWLKIAHISNIHFDNQRYTRNMSWSDKNYFKCCLEDSYIQRYFKMLERTNPGDSSEKPDMQQIGNFLSFASRGDRVGLNLMLRRNISPNVQDYDLRTALHLAASEGHAPIVELLLHYQADVNLKDRWHRTPLTDARLYGHRDICRILEVNGGKDFYSDQPMTVRHEPEVNEVNIDIAELNPEDSEKIVQGVFGESEKVKWRGTWVVKTIIKRHIDYPVKMKLLTKDNTLLRELRHPNIVQFLGSIVQAEQMILITEFLPKGNLEEMLNKKLRFDLLTALHYALDIARGMNYLHKHKPLAIVHNHLDSRNLLLDGGDHLKISEYWVQMLYEPICSNEEHSQVNVSSINSSHFRDEMEKEDIRSFGFICYQMIEGRHSLSKMSHDISHLKAINFQPTFQINRCPARIEQLIKSCTSKDASERPSFEGVMAILEEFSGSLGRAAWLSRVLSKECAAHYCT